MGTIKINSTRVMGTHETISCRYYITFKVMFSFLVFFVCHAPSPEHRAFEVCIVRTSIALPFIGRFRRGFQRFSQQIALSDTLHSSHVRR